MLSVGEYIGLISALPPPHFERVKIGLSYVSEKGIYYYPSPSVFPIVFSFINLMRFDITSKQHLFTVDVVVQHQFKRQCDRKCSHSFFFLNCLI
jgi:hypothetical protein